MKSLRQRLESACVLSELREKVRKHREAYSLEIFPNSETLNDNSSRDSVGAKMGRHMCDCFERYIDEVEAEALPLLSALIDVAEAADLSVETTRSLAERERRIHEALARLEKLCGEGT